MRSNTIYGTHKAEALAFLTTLTAGSVYLVVTSPPYNAPLGFGPRAMPETLARYHAWLHDVIRECSRILTDHGVLVMVVGGSYDEHKNVLPLDWSVGPAMLKNGLAHWNRIIWTGRTASPGINKLAPAYETVLVHGKGKRRFSMPPEDDVKTDLWTSVPQIGTEGRHGHKDAFSEAFVSTILRLYSRENALVCDPFAGSGTTELICERMGRRYVGCDIGYEDVRTKRGVPAPSACAGSGYSKK